jgi:hypothetical protein
LFPSSSTEILPSDELEQTLMDREPSPSPSIVLRWTGVKPNPRIAARNSKNLRQGIRAGIGVAIKRISHAARYRFRGGLPRL